MTGGVDVHRHPTHLDDNRARKLLNWSLHDIGALKVRPGYQLFSTTSLGAQRGQGGDRIYLSSGRVFTLFAYNGQLYKPSDTGAWGSTASTGPPVYSTLSTANEIHFSYDRDLVAVFDGANRPRKSTNGSSWTQLGIDASTAASTLADASSGGLLATTEYEIGFTYQDNSLGHESNGGVISTITRGGTTGAIRIEITGSTDPQVDSINIYARNKSAGETVRRKATSLANVSGSTVSVLLDSSNWLANAAEPTDHTVPPVLSFGTVWKNRWWARHATVGNRLHFTQVFQPQSWPGTFFLDIPFERGDEIRAVVPVGDTLLVFGGTDVFLVVGQTSLDFEVRPALESQDGALGPRAVSRIENGVLHAGATGVYIQDGATDQLLSEDITEGWEDGVVNSKPADLAKVATVYHDKKREVRVSVPRVYPFATAGEWVLDLARTRQQEHPAWTQTDRTIGGYIHWDGVEAVEGDRGRLFSWSDTSGQVFEESTGTTANSSNMTAEYEGPTFSMGLNRVRAVETWGEFEPNDGAFTVETYVDELGQGGRSVDIGSGRSVYGTAVYGTATYSGAGRRLFHHNLPMSAEGRTLRKTAVYSGKAAFSWFTYAYGIVPERRPREWSD